MVISCRKISTYVADIPSERADRPGGVRPVGDLDLALAGDGEAGRR